MTERNHTALLAQLDRFKRMVRANRMCCDSDLAREIHVNVIAILNDLCTNIREAMELGPAVARETDPAKRAELACRLRQREEAIASHWNEPEPYALGGWHCIERDNFFNPVTERTEWIDDDLILQPVPDERLGGLAAILDALAAETPITFERVIVFWKAMSTGDRQIGNTSQDGSDNVIYF